MNTRQKFQWIDLNTGDWMFVKDIRDKDFNDFINDARNHPSGSSAQKIIKDYESAYGCGNYPDTQDWEYQDNGCLNKRVHMCSACYDRFYLNELVSSVLGQGYQCLECISGIRTYKTGTRQMSLLGD